MDDLESAAELYEKGRLGPEASLEIQDHLRKVMSATSRQEADALALVAVTKLCDFLNHWNNAAQPADPRVKESIEALGKQLEQALDRSDLQKIFLLRYGNGFFHRTQGDHRKALAEFDAAWTLSHEAGKPLPQALSQSGAEHVYIGQPEQALAQFRRAIQYSSSKTHVRGYCFWALGRCLAFLQRYDEAIAWLLLSVELWGEVSYNRLYLASCFEWAGDHAAAAATLQAVDEKFSRYTIQRVIEDEGTNPNRDPFVVGGRQRFHEGLRNAGMPEE